MPGEAPIFDELRNRARALPFDTRRKIVESIRETDLHEHLRQLFSAMEPSYQIEVTHGVDERGKDLVIVRTDQFSNDVIGVVVKRGDIRATTAGEVDDIRLRIEDILSHRAKAALREIESQVFQARAHAAEITASYARLPVTRVFVVIAGSISNRVRSRLEGELSSTTVYDLQWLVEKFTEHLPEVFFESVAINVLIRKVQRLEVMHGVKSQEVSLNLSEYFTEPLLSPVNLYADDGASAGQVIGQALSKRRIPFSRLSDEIQKRSRVVIVGDPGVGKSGALAKFTVEQLRAAADRLSRVRRSSNIEIPLLVTATNVGDASDFDELWRSSFGDVDPLPNVSVNVLLVDALDEAPFSRRQAIIEKAEAFAEQLGSNLVISGRKIEVLESAREGYVEFELLPFQFRQAVTYLSKMLAHNPSLFDSLRSGLERIRFHFPLIPLSLRMLVSIAEESKDVPASITELYDRFFDTAFGRDDSEKGIEVLFDYIVKRRFVASLAYAEFFVKDRLEISAEDFQSFLGEYGRTYIPMWNEDTRVRLVEELQRAGILHLNANVSFRHRTFLDYFIAAHLFEYREEFPNLYSALAEAHYSSRWDEVTFFYVGLQRRISQGLLDEILDYEGSGDVLHDSIAKTLTGRLLQAGWHSPGELKQAGLQQAMFQLSAVREQFLEQVSNEAGSAPVPRLFGDYVTLWLADTALSSGTLIPQLRSEFNRAVHGDSRQDLFIAINALFALRDLVSKEELLELTRTTVEFVDRLRLARHGSDGSGNDELTAEEEARALIVLGRIETGDRALARGIRNKLQRMARRAPDTIRGLIPKRR